MDKFENGVLGKGTPVLDAALKVTGQLNYVDDMSATSGVMALRRFPAAWMGFRAGCCTCFPRAL